MDGIRTQLSASAIAMGTAIGGGTLAIIEKAASAVYGFMATGIKGATDLGESLSKVSATFGASAGVLTAAADELASKYGLSKQAILDAGSAIGLVGKAAGQSQAQAAGMGATMAKLAADASSFYNVPLEEALNKIRSGLVGEAEPLRAFGVLLNEEKVAAEAVALGLAKTTKEVDDQAKVLARASLIQKGLADATGDLERTADSTANQWRKFTGSMTNMAVEIGSTLMPAINAIINLATEMTSGLASAFESSKGAFESFAAVIVEAVAVIGVAWRNLPDLWEIVTLEAQEMGTNIFEIAETIPENLSRIGSWIADNWVNMLVDAFKAVGTAFGNLGTNLRNLWDAVLNYFKTGEFTFNWKPILEGFKATTEALPTMLEPNLTSMQKEIDEVGKRIADRESARAAAIPPKAAAGAKAGAEVAAAAAKKEKEFKSETVGVAEFASKLRESIYGAKDETAKKQLDEAQKQTKLQTETRDALKKGMPAVLS
jgi:hypothetical protein